MMEGVVCPLCSGDGRRVLWRVRRDPFLRAARGNGVASYKVACTTCGFVYHQPRLSAAEIRRLPRHEVRADVLGCSSEVPTSDYVYWKRLKAEKDAEWFNKHIGVRGAGRLLEVGCAEGTLLSLLRERGWRTGGVEPMPAYADYGRRTYNLEVVTSYIEDLDLPSGSFDAVLLLLTIEHIAAPFDVLASVRRLLIPDGVLYVQLPNVLTPVDTPNQFLGAHHLYLFTPATALAFLEKARFTVCAQDDSDRIWKAIARPDHAERSPRLPRFDEAEFLTIRKTLRQFHRRHTVETLRASVRARLRRVLVRRLGEERTRSLVAAMRRLVGRGPGQQLVHPHYRKP